MEEICVVMNAITLHVFVMILVLARVMRVADVRISNINDLVRNHFCMCTKIR